MSNELENVQVNALRRTGGKDTPAGFDDVDNQTDLRIPRLAILQATSALCTEGKAKMGLLANSLTKEVYGESVEFIPLFMFKSRAQFEMGKGLVMLSRDNITVSMGKDDFAQYIGQAVEKVHSSEWEGNEPPKFNLVYNFPILLTGKMNEFPISLSMMKTAVKTAKDLLSLARFSGEDMFARVYTLTTKIEKNDKGVYAVPVVNFLRRCADEEYTTAKQMFEGLYKRKHSIEVDLESETASINTAE